MIFLSKVSKDYLRYNPIRAGTIKESEVKEGGGSCSGTLSNAPARPAERAVEACTTNPAALSLPQFNTLAQNVQQGGSSIQTLRNDDAIPASSLNSSHEVVNPVSSIPVSPEAPRLAAAAVNDPAFSSAHGTFFAVDPFAFYRYQCQMMLAAAAAAEQRSMIYVSLLSPHAMVPRKANSNAAGFDLFAFEDIILTPAGMSVIRTGVRAIPPKGHYLRITGRSGLTLDGILVQTGVVDPDYSGEIAVIVYNKHNRRIVVERGERIAQMIVEKFAENCQITVVDASTFQANITSTNNSADLRGNRGFGSSGI